MIEMTSENTTASKISIPILRQAPVSPNHFSRITVLRVTIRILKRDL